MVNLRLVCSVLVGFASMAAGAEPDSIAVVKPKRLRDAAIRCERITLGEADDYKPSVAMLPDSYREKDEKTHLEVVRWKLPQSGVAEPKPVEIIAHRGASYEAPENTVASFKLAWEQKADGAELDIHLTKDGKIVVIHDASTKRTTGTDWKIAEQTLAELRTLDAGKWKGERFAGEKLPTLDEMLATTPAGKKVFVEVKCGPEIVPELDRVLKAAKLKPEQTPVISFNADVIAAVKKARPELAAYWLVSLKDKAKEKKTVEDLIVKAQEIRADGLDVSVSDLVDEAFAAKLKAARLRLDVWTVDDPAIAKRVAPFVAGITTNRPAWLREQLK